MSTSTRSKIIQISLFVALFLIDQLSKTYFISHLKTQAYYIIEALPFLDFVYAWNYGISFGLFSKHYQYSNYTFLILNTLILIYLIYITINTKQQLMRYGLIFIIAGACGNLFDRALRGAVFDFIYFNYGNLSFPAFNLADAFISIGALMLLISMYRNK